MAFFKVSGLKNGQIFCCTYVLEITAFLTKVDYYSAYILFTLHLTLIVEL